MLLEMIFLLWFPVSSGGYNTMPVWTSDDIHEDCNHDHAYGCNTEDSNGMRIIVIDKDMVHASVVKGCTVLTHEALHLWGLKERDIPHCPVTVGGSYNR